MVRLTKRLGDGKTAMDCSSCELKGKNCTALGCLNRLKDRLAVYEDTGLEPGEENHILTKEELYQMNGEPVWVSIPDQKYAKFGKWALVINNEIDGIEFSCAYAVGDRWDFLDYGNSWIAYRRKPEDGTK